jgi:integrase
MKKRSKRTLLLNVLGDYFEAKSKLSAETQLHYHRSIKQFGAFLGRAPTLADLSDETCGAFMQHTLQHGLTEVTANQRVKQIRALWEWAARKRLVWEFPEFQWMKEPPRKPNVWTKAELDKLLATCATRTGYVGPVRADQFWLLFHYLIIDTVEHAATLLQLRWSWFNAKKGTLAIPGSARKCESPIVHHLTSRTVELLTKIIHPVRDRIFECPFSTSSSFFHRYRRLVAAAGLPTQRGKAGPHRTRETILASIAGSDRDVRPPDQRRKRTA